MRQVPYPRVAGIPSEAQRQLRSNFEAVVKALQEGTTVDVPFPKISGLPPEAQRQILRNFQDLKCDCAGGVPLTTVNTSDTFSVPTGNVAGNNTDALLGGAPSLWTATPADNWPSNVTAGTMASPVTGTSTTIHTINVELANTDQSVQFTLAQTLANSRIIGLNTRWVDINNYYTMEFFRASAGVQELYITKNVAGTPTTLAGPYAHIAAVGDVLRFTVLGSDLKVYLNGALILSATDTSLTTGTRAGVYALGDNAAKVTNFIALV